MGDSVWSELGAEGCGGYSVWNELGAEGIDGVRDAWLFETERKCFGISVLVHFFMAVVFVGSVLVVRATVDFDIGLGAGPSLGERGFVMELEAAGFGASMAFIADESALQPIPLQNCAPHVVGDVATRRCDRALLPRPRSGAARSTKPLLHFLSQQYVQGSIEHGGKIAIGHAMAQELLGSFQFEVGGIRNGELNFVAARCEGLTH